MRWDLKFPEPLVVPGRRPLVTLRDAATYILKLPKTEQDEVRWQKAIHCLIQTADHGGPKEFARLGVVQAITQKVVVYDTSRKDPVWRNTRKLVRDR